MRHSQRVLLLAHSRPPQAFTPSSSDTPWSDDCESVDRTAGAQLQLLPSYAGRSGSIAGPGGHRWETVDWAWASSAAASSRASTFAPGWEFATPMCAASGARTRDGRRRPLPSPARCASERRRLSRRSRPWWRRPRSTASGSAAPTTRASRTWSASWRRWARAESWSASPVRSRWLETPPRRDGWWSWSPRPGCCTAISKTSSSRRGSSGGARSSGRAAPRSAGGRTWPGLRRSTADLTCRGSGRETCKGAAS